MKPKELILERARLAHNVAMATRALKDAKEALKKVDLELID